MGGGVVNHQRKVATGLFLLCSAVENRNIMKVEK